MDLYAQNIIDHYRNPRNSGRLSRPTVSHREANYSCGDIIEIDIILKKGTIQHMKFRGEGCAVSQAAVSILSEYIVGKSITKVLRLKEVDVKKLLGVTISSRRQKCALLGLLAIQNGLLKYRQKPLRQFKDITEIEFI